MEHPGDPVTRCRRRRRKAGGGRAGHSRIPLRTSIRERPYGQDDRSRFGEREADGVIGAGPQPALFLFNRKLRF